MLCSPSTPRRQTSALLRSPHRRRSTRRASRRRTSRLRRSHHLGHRTPGNPRLLRGTRRSCRLIVKTRSTDQNLPFQLRMGGGIPPFDPRHQISGRVWLGSVPVESGAIALSYNKCRCYRTLSTADLLSESVSTGCVRSARRRGRLGTASPVRLDLTDACAGGEATVSLRVADLFDAVYRIALVGRGAAGDRHPQLGTQAHVGASNSRDVAPRRSWACFSGFVRPLRAGAARTWRFRNWLLGETGQDVVKGIRLVRVAVALPWKTTFPRSRSTAMGSRYGASEAGARQERIAAGPRCLRRRREGVVEHVGASILRCGEVRTDAKGEEKREDRKRVALRSARPLRKRHDVLRLEALAGGRERSWRPPRRSGVERVSSRTTSACTAGRKASFSSRRSDPRRIG